MILTQTIPWADFSDKHKHYIHNAQPYWGEKSKKYHWPSTICVAEGAIRSGKTIDHCIIAAAHLEVCRDKFHLASGSDVGNAKLNIGECNGFGLAYLFGGRCRWGKYRNNEALFINSQTGEKIVIFTGGGKSNSYKHILGNSYGLWIATEINEHYDSDDSRESFIKVAFGRQVAALDPLVLWDLNPCNPKHRIYEDYIDKYRDDKQPGYLYEHFTIDDNLSITDERREEIKSRYDPNSVWYKRDILGKRCIAEGLIYQTFADNTSEFLIDDPLKWCHEHNHRITRLMVGVDFGGTKSATTFVAVGITNKLTVLALDQDWMDSNDLDPDKLNRRFVEFVRRVLSVYGAYGEIQTRADNEESVLIRGIRNAVQRENLRCSVHNAKKMEINNRIKLTLLLMAQQRFYMARKCEHLIEALQTAVYDPKSYEDVRLDDGTSDIDSLDAYEYAIEPWYQQLLRYGEKPYISPLSGRSY